MTDLLRALKSLIFSDPERASRGPRRRGTPPDECRDDGRERGMTKSQFLTELEKLTEVE